MTLRNFHCPDELWEQFLRNISEFESASHALRELMKQHIEAKETK